LVSTGRHHAHTAIVKEEPGSPAKSAPKRKAYSTTGSNPIGSIKYVGKPQGISKRQKTSAGGTSHVQFNMAGPSNTHPAPRPVKKSAQAAKANPKHEDIPKPEGIPRLDMGELFERLGQEFHAVVRICETIAEAMNSTA